MRSTYVSDIPAHIGQASYGDFGNGQSLPQMHALCSIDDDVNPIDGTYSQFFKGRCVHKSRTLTGNYTRFRPGCVGSYVPVTLFRGAGAPNDLDANQLATADSIATGVWPLTMNDDPDNYQQDATLVGGYLHAGGYTIYTTEFDNREEAGEYRCGDYLHAPTIPQITAGGNPELNRIAAGKFHRIKSWNGGAGAPLAYGTDHIAGIVIFNRDEIIQAATQRNLQSVLPDGQTLVSPYPRAGHDHHGMPILHFTAVHFPGAEDMDALD